MRILKVFEIHTQCSGLRAKLSAFHTWRRKKNKRQRERDRGRRKAKAKKQNCLSGMIKEFGAGAGAEAGPFPIGRAKEVLKKAQHCE